MDPDTFLILEDGWGWVNYLMLPSSIRRESLMLTDIDKPKAEISDEEDMEEVKKESN